MRRLMSVVLATLAGSAFSAHAAVNPLDQVSGGSATGLYSCSSGNACIDDFEINGIAGPGGGTFPLTGVQAVFFSPSGQLPTTATVNIYTNDGNLNRLRTMPEGDVFATQFSLLSGLASIQPFPVMGETGNFPGGFLLTIPFNFDIPFGMYYLSISLSNENPETPFFISGSSNVTEGTPDNLIAVFNQGPGGQLAVVTDNAAYRVMGIPTPGAAGLVLLGGLCAARRRRA